MVIGMDFGNTGNSPYIKRKEQVYGRTSGRPTGSTTGGTDSTGGATGTGSGIQTTMNQTPYSGFLKNLTTPIDYKNQSQQRYNLARGQIQSGTKTEMEQMEGFMGGKGFRAGESGIADTMMGGIARRGSERLGQASLGINIAEGDRAQQYAQMNLQRQTAGAGLALTGEEGALNRMMDYYKTKTAAETAEFQPWWSGFSQGY